MAEVIYSPKFALQDQSTFKVVASCPEYEVNASGTVSVIITGTIMKHDRIRNVPPRVRLYPKEGGETVRAVGALVLEAFVGKPVMPNVVPLFLDGDLSSCTLANLRWGTHEEAEDLEATYVTPSPTPRRSISDGGKGRRRSNLTEDECREIRTSSGSAAELAERFDCSVHTVYRVLRRASKSKPSTGVRPGLDEAQVLDIMTSPERVSTLADRFGVSVTHINAIRRGAVSAYTHVQQGPVLSEPLEPTTPDTPVASEPGEPAMDEFVPVTGFPKLEVSRSVVVRHALSKTELVPFGQNAFLPRRVRVGLLARSVAYILLDAFVGPDPYSTGFVAFDDNDVTNIDLANLRWCTQGEALRQLHERKRSFQSKIGVARQGGLEAEALKDIVEPAVSSAEAAAPSMEPAPDVVATLEVDAKQTETVQAETVSADPCPGGWRPAVFLPEHLRRKRAIHRRLAFAC